MSADVFATVTLIASLLGFTVIFIFVFRFLNTYVKPLFFRKPTIKDLGEEADASVRDDIQL